MFGKSTILYDYKSKQTKTENDINKSIIHAFLFADETDPPQLLMKVTLIPMTF